MSQIPKIVVDLAEKGKQILSSCENIAIFGSILTSQVPNDVDIIATYQPSNLDAVLKETELYNSIVFYLVGVNLHMTLFTVEEAKKSTFYQMIINGHCHFIK